MIVNKCNCLLIGVIEVYVGVIENTFHVHECLKELLLVS